MMRVRGGGCGLVMAVALSEDIAPSRWAPLSAPLEQSDVSDASGDWMGVCPAHSYLQALVFRRSGC